MTTQNASQELRAGIATADISPPPGVGMAGYGSRPLSTGSKGNASPLVARVLVLTDGATSLALVATDLVWFYSDETVQRAKDAWGLDHVALLGSHIHCGPSTSRARAAEANTTEWLDETEEKIVDVIGRAARNTFPARITSGSGPEASEYFAYNRRRVEPDGGVSMWWSNPERKPNGPVDRTLRLLRIDDEAGNLRVVLVHYACHPVILGPENLYVSSGFPGAMVDHVEAALGGNVTALFVQGAGGDVHPYERSVHGDYGLDLVRRTGVSLGDEALRILKTMPPPVNASQPALKVRESSLTIPYHNERDGTAEVGVMAAVINNEIALAVISGEPFVRLQLAFNQASPLEHSCLLGYACFGNGMSLPAYLPDREATRTGGYGADGSANNPLAAGAGEALIDRAVSMIGELTLSNI